MQEDNNKDGCASLFNDDDAEEIYEVCKKVEGSLADVR